ncbi:MAG: phosphopantothenoylcysteine decarboxylase [Verrucomicrobiales bacterium]|nr:phosphopantothenoylcysteine decarboxylase [Verrucomicrobiales bacterium]
MRFLITAGPTREPIDPVRYLSNRSSGKMGYALAEAALGRGHEVVLISGPVNIPAPDGATVVRVETAQEMYDAVAERIGEAEVAIFCAAVADYRVAEVAGEKIKKTGETLTLTLIKNPDILGSARSVFGFTGLLIGFAAETEKLAEHATGKLLRKGCDLLVANDVSRSDIAFDRDENEVELFYRDGRHETLARASKREIAEGLVERVEELG